jgi:hypothetical protein
MSRNNSTSSKSKHQAGQPYQLEILQPGTQGWNDQQPQPSGQFPSGRNTLTTEQVRNSLEIPFNYLRNCQIGQALLWDAQIVCHLGRNSWKIYTDKSA